MKYKLPDVLIVVLLAVAIFGVGTIFAGSYEAPNQQHRHGSADTKEQTNASLPDERATVPQQASQTSQQRGEHEKGPLETFVEVKLTDVLLVIFTAILAWRTSGLFVETAGLRDAADKQRLDSLRSIEATERAANAAVLSARAAVAIQLPVISIKPDAISLGDGRQDGQEYEECSVTSVIISNLGPTRAYPIEILYGWTVGSELPLEPSYRFLDDFLTNYILEPDPKITPRRRLTMAMPLKPGQRTEIMKGNYLWFYCQLRYRDFMGEIRSNAFCWRWTNTGLGLGWRAEKAPNYNRKT